MTNITKLHNSRPSEFEIICIADINSEPVQWIWRDRLARGKLTLLGGLPGLGKSQIACDIAARLSKGAHWPNADRAHVCNSIFICSEDDIADTVRPRLEAAGADLDRVHIIQSTFTKKGRSKTFNLQDDLDGLRVACQAVGDVGFINFDALTSYMGKVDNASTTDIRSVLEPVGAFAKDIGAAILGITHPPKSHQANAIHAFTGSLAYVAAARLVFTVAKEPETGRHLLLCVKNNLGPLAPGRGFDIATKEISNGIIAPFIQWDDKPVDVTANEALAAASRKGEGGELHHACELLQDFLRDGPKSAKEGMEFAEANGISSRTLERARAKLGVKSEKHVFGPGGGWFWRMPA